MIVHLRDVDIHNEDTKDLKHKSTFCFTTFFGVYTPATQQKLHSLYNVASLLYPMTDSVIFSTVYVIKFHISIMSKSMNARTKTMNYTIKNYMFHLGMKSA